MQAKRQMETSQSILTWETEITTSLNNRVVLFNSYDFVAAGDRKKFVVTVAGAAYSDLPNIQVRYLPGIHTDLSCIFDEDFGATTTTMTSSSTTSTTTSTTTETTDGTTMEPTTTEAPCADDPNFCQGKADGNYRHCKCKKWYQCYQLGQTKINTCAAGTLWNGNICDWAANVNTNNCEL
ncbi:Oidioi.mRNA.OKI2018_I69.chr2.g5093.t1.cds [Oikopleura dioica]|uniref:chitinase n=1 Tax=Oikopleura dioica TaxID=34765 RepID=A0ABN7SZ44_OIKDI|nr:Oidioi.mRNA.OKI2018_I69.chr2.g5093.t1.cds [Oikopleura dioica]